MNKSSLITLNDKSVKNNISFLRRRFGKRVIISAVVKANAYGHGIEQTVPLFERHGIDHLSVFSFMEAERVRRSMTSSGTVMIMGWISDEDIIEAVRHDFEFFVFNIERLELAREAAVKTGKPARIHLEAETGMNRSGLNIPQLTTAIDIILESSDNFVIEGFCTHLAGAESISNHLRIKKQLGRYNKMLALLKEKGITPGLRHVANSAASFVYPRTRMDLVRVGIMMYGFWSSIEVFIHFIASRTDKTDPLNRVLGWESRIMTVKEIKTGEYVGYGISFIAQTEMKAALIPIGYSNGYSRSLSNKGRVLINGQFCNVIGIVNMNMIMVDITEVPQAKVGDQVVIIGKQGRYEIKVSAFSDISDKLNYEVLTHLSESIRRSVINY